jgi:RNA-directed DNA polymerase
VSAGNTARSTLAAVQGDRVRALQHVLYRAAKADPKRRFHALRDKVYCEDVLWRAWIAVRRNNGAPGIDKITLADVEEYGVTRLLGELAVELRAGRWRPRPARRVLIPKPGSTGRRPLAIATDDSYCPSCKRVSGCFWIGAELCWSGPPWRAR